MTVDTPDFDRQVAKHPLKPDFYSSLTAEEVAFHETQTGFHDDELREHILSVQKDAYEVFPYPCIRWLTFARLQVSRSPVYAHLLELGRTRPDVVFLEIGCCFGSDMRKVVADGFPAQKCIATDLRPEFWRLGYRLFNDSPETFPVPFLPGDLFDAEFLTPTLPVLLSVSASSPPALSSLATLTPLAGHVSALFAAEVFHLFSAEKQVRLARALAGLLSPVPGSVIFGWQVGSAGGGLFELQRPGIEPLRLWYHSPQSWREMWEGVFASEGVEVRVEAELQKLPPTPENNLNVTEKLAWSVTRV